MPETSGLPKKTQRMRRGCRGHGQRDLAESFGPMTFAEWCAMDDQIGLMVCGLMTEAEVV